MTDRIALIRDRLQQAFGPDSEITLKDQSHLHAGHEGARDGRGHFELTLISADFAGRNRIQRHKMVYDALGKLLESDIHAIRIRARTPSE